VIWGQDQLRHVGTTGKSGAGHATREIVNPKAGPPVEFELELTSSTSIGAGFLNQQVGGEIQRIELGIAFPDVLRICFLCECR
jgi:hypothetical protein